MQFNSISFNFHICILNRLFTKSLTFKDYLVKFKNYGNKGVAVRGKNQGVVEEKTIRRKSHQKRDKKS